MSSSVLGSKSGKRAPAKSLPSIAISMNVEMPLPGRKAKPTGGGATDNSKRPDTVSIRAPVGSWFVKRS